MLPRGGSGGQGKEGLSLCWRGEGNGGVAEGHYWTPGPLPPALPLVFCDSGHSEIVIIKLFFF